MTKKVTFIDDGRVNNNSARVDGGMVAAAGANNSKAVGCIDGKFVNVEKLKQMIVNSGNFIEPNELSTGMVLSLFQNNLEL